MTTSSRLLLLLSVLCADEGTAFVVLPKITTPTPTTRLSSAIPQSDFDMVTDEQLLNGVFAKQVHRRQDFDLTRRSTEGQDEQDLMDARLDREHQSKDGVMSGLLGTNAVLGFLLLVVTSGILGGAVNSNNNNNTFHAPPAPVVVEQKELVMPAATLNIDAVMDATAMTTMQQQQMSVPASILDPAITTMVGPRVEDLEREAQQDKFIQQQQHDAEDIMGMGMMEQAAGFMF